MPLRFLDGGGEMGALMRQKDWAQTPLGSVGQWPQSLRTTVSTCLHSRFPILIWWGPQFVKLYNDAYREVIAGKHPQALGRPGREVWPEIWDIIGPMLESVVQGGRATWSEDQFLPLERHGFSEECYFTFSYSPIHDESGNVGGVFSAVTETTARVIGERRLRVLQELAVTAAADDAATVCGRALDVLSRDRADVPFALIYLLDEDGTTLRRAGSTGTAPGHAPSPTSVDLQDGDRPLAWPFREALAGGTLVADAGGDRTRRAFVTPIPGGAGARGVLVAGLSPMLTVDDQYRGFAALVAREIGGSIARAQALEEERRRAEALAEIDRVKTAFFANVSHEFRTPLTLLLSPLEEALGSGVNVVHGEELATVHRNALRLMKLVNTLLDFARIEAGRAQATLVPTNLSELTTDLASTFRSAMTRAGLLYTVECDALAEPVAVDRDAWEKIVLNLLSNALKFTFDGSVTIRLERSGRDILLQVVDTGVGIPAAEIPNLFQRFHRVRGAKSRTHEGSGIGLALVNELVKMHGGTLAVQSEVNRGTTFTVAIPARLAADLAVASAARAADAVARPYVAEALRWLPEPAPAEAEAQHEAPHGGSTILVVDDNADMREYVRRLLADRWRVLVAPDGRSALTLVQAAPPALIISDVMMPVLDGFELLAALRADPMTRSVPVILLSARAGEEASVEGLHAGADDYIVKPFSARELRARVEAQLFRSELRTLQAAHERRLLDLFRNAPVAVALLRGPDHLFDFVNGEYLRVIGDRQVIGRPIAEALPELEEQGIVSLLDGVYASGLPYAADSHAVALNRGPQGMAETAVFNFVYQPMRNAEGSVDGVAVIAVDVTELARARQEAEDANQAKDHFLAVLAHELRTPLAPIVTAVELLDRKGPDDPGLRKLRETISRQARHLLGLVEDLLDVGRIITGKLRLEKTRVDLNAIVRQAVDMCATFIQSRGHTLELHLADTPLEVEADASRLVQVVSNLLNNAAKYMEDGGRIEIAAVREGGSALVRVRDYGIGIPPDMLDRVFDRFVQVGASDHSGGLGIGLSIVKSIIDLHGGAVSASSQGPGNGSEFAVSLPVLSPVASGVGG